MTGLFVSIFVMGIGFGLMLSAVIDISRGRRITRDSELARRIEDQCGQAERIARVAACLGCPSLVMTDAGHMCQAWSAPAADVVACLRRKRAHQPCQARA